MSTYTQYEARVARSGLLIFSSNTGTALADCQAAAATYAAAHPLVAVCVIPKGWSTIGGQQLTLPGPQAVVTAST